MTSMRPSAAACGINEPEAELKLIIKDKDRMARTLGKYKVSLNTTRRRPDREGFKRFTFLRKFMWNGHRKTNRLRKSCFIELLTHVILMR